MLQRRYLINSSINGGHRVASIKTFVFITLFVSAPAFAGFDWGGDCDSGDGSFQQYIPYQGQGVVVGHIPVNKRNVLINLTAQRDVDVQLITQDGYQIIAWPGGALNGPTQECTTYRQVRYCYSGYNGTGGSLGNESISIEGDTNVPLVMRAWGYQSGSATVDYSWQAVPTCNEKGDGAFRQYIPYRDTVVVGDIPANKVNVKIELSADYGRDVDIQIYDGNVAVVQWPNGLLFGPAEQTTDYQGMTIIYSGYNGIGGNWGHETIEIQGRVTRPLTMKAYGYSSGTADVSYQWGVGAGERCGGRTNPPLPACGSGLLCKGPMLSVDVPGECHSENWCHNDQLAPTQCASLNHPAGPGHWGCHQYVCQWRYGGLAGEGEMCGGIAGFQCADGLECKGMDPDIADAAGTCRDPMYCDILTVDQDCHGVMHPMSPGAWGCRNNQCYWVHQAAISNVHFEDFVQNPQGYAEANIIQMTWSVDGELICHPCDPIPGEPESCANPCEKVVQTFGDPTPYNATVVKLLGLSCQGGQCDIDRGQWVKVWGVQDNQRAELRVLRADPGITCSLADQSCGPDQFCQLGIGCPTPDNCGINPPGMCLENRADPTPLQCNLAGEYLGYVSTNPDVCAVVHYSCLEPNQLQIAVNSSCGCGCCLEQVVVDCEPGGGSTLEQCQQKVDAIKAVCPETEALIAL